MRFLGTLIFGKNKSWEKSILGVLRWEKKPWEKRRLGKIALGKTCWEK